MNRKEFLRLSSLGLISIPMISKLNALDRISKSFSKTAKMPVLFLGHGSPMNGIEENEFVAKFRNIGKNLVRPNAIVVISAHWETKGTFVTAMENPRTIHDFGGFPKSLYEVQYPAPGSPELAKEISSIIQPANTVSLDEKWGLDHGAWTVVKHLFPMADVPVIQLSLDYNLTTEQHFRLAAQLSSLRNRGVLFIGSGNIVHNLGKVAWNRLDDYYAYDWAIEANDKIKSFVLNENFKQLIDFKNQGAAFQLAIPTPEHYLPLLYTLALKDVKDQTVIFNDKPLGGSLTMTSFKFG